MTERAGTGTFLLEVGCEEIPAPMIPGALEDLASGLVEALGPLAAGAEPFTGFGGPRRLTALLGKVVRREEDRDEVVHGPPRSAAFDAEGRPTKAAEGFARKHGVAVGDLGIVETPKGEVVAATRHVEGRTAAGILSDAVPEVLRRMRFRKTMRWGDRGYLFVRPVHWILALFDGDVVPFEFMGARSGRTTRGHRFLGPGPHEVPHPDRYEEILSARGAVVVRHAERRKRILEAADRAASEAGGRIRSDEALVDELTFLTEHPAIVAGSFPEVFLELPEPVLMTAMRHHQKYLTIEGPDGRLRNAFVGVLGTDPDAEGLIRRGNEWVLKARLADARFFFREDQKLPLADRVPALSGVTFHAHLGSYADKSERLGPLLGLLARATGTGKSESAALMEAARLCKTDLTTGMVGEFPELQGVVGGIYARMQGHDETCARAMEEHYLPAGAGDPVPSPGAPSLLALADKIDTLAVCFSAGLIPKGSADPYALRRAALGVLRILIENGIRLDLDPVLRAAIAAAATTRGGTPPAKPGGRKSRREVPDDPGKALGAFLAQRLEFLIVESGVRIDVARAAIAAGWSDPLRAWRRAAALDRLRGEEDFLALAAAAKRVRNILAQAAAKGIETGSGVNAGLLKERAETMLHEEIERVDSRAAASAGREDYAEALSAIAGLRPAVDRFFDDVLVMDEDEGVRRNRLSLLTRLSGLLSREGDFAEVVVEGG